MEVLRIRFCTVTPEAAELTKFFQNLGLTRKDLSEHIQSDDFCCGIFPAGSSWIEVWPVSENAPAGTMLQIIVDDADAFAEHARLHGLAPQGPTDANGERIYSLQAPSGLAVTFQSSLKSQKR